MSAYSLIAVAAAVVLSASGARAGLLTQDPCPGPATAPEVWMQLGSNVLENLLFAEGSLWVSDSTAGDVRRFASDGTEGEGLTATGSPGGLALGADGMIYAGAGNNIVEALLDTGNSKVVRFDPAAPDLTVEDYAAGFSMANGMTFDPAGNLYVSNDANEGLVRIPAADPGAWHLLNDAWGTNGLVVDPDGDELWAAITFDQRSPIARVPLGSPGDWETGAELTFGVVSLEPALYPNGDPSKPLLGVKGLDDMTRSDGPGWKLYVVANGTGELLEVDPETGESCLVAGGLQNPSSVRIAPAGSDFDGSGEALTFWITEFSGAIRTVGYTPAAP